MKKSSFVIVFTDLDGTLLNHYDYSYQAAIPVIEELKQKQIPIIPVTSKTRREVQTLISDLELSDPFVTENGSSIFIPQNYNFFQPKFPKPEGEVYGNYVLKRLGCTYSDARNGLRALGEKLGVSLKGFGDLTEEDIQQLTSLSLENAREAKAREFTEPFVPPEDVASESIEEVAETLGFRVLLGGRFCHLLSKDAGKGKAVKWLVEQYQNIYQHNNIVTIGLGDSPNDIEMLEAVDHPIIIPGKTGKANSKLVEKGLGNWVIATYPAPKGWADSIRNILDYLVT